MRNRIFARLHFARYPDAANTGLAAPNEPFGPPRSDDAPALRTPPPRFAHHNHRLLMLRRAFTPTRPQFNLRRIAGRKHELLRILDAISDNRSHVVLYGDRGRGKTSLVNLVAAAARNSGYMVGRYSCDQDSDFDDIVRGAARDLPKCLLADSDEKGAEPEGCEAALPRDRLRPRDVALLPSRFSNGHMLLIIDEFDRVMDVSTRTRLADTIKQVSDRGAPLSFLIVGVSDSLEDLLGHHPSIQRNVTAVPLPLLTAEDANEIIEMGSREAELEFPEPIRKIIIRFARGVPYIVHLLALHFGEQAIKRGAQAVARVDTFPAFDRAAAELSPHVRLAYERLIKGELGNAMHTLLFKLATVEHDRLGLLRVEEDGSDIRVAGQAIELGLWQSLLESGAVRPCRAAASGLCAFTEPMLLHYVLLRAAIDAERAW